MNDLRALYRALKRELPQAAVLKLDDPTRSRQAGWLDIECGGKRIAVEWRREEGFGVSLLEQGREDPTVGLFEGPDEVLDTWAQAKEHIMILLERPTLNLIQSARSLARA